MNLLCGKQRRFGFITRVKCSSLRVRTGQPAAANRPFLRSRSSRNMDLSFVGKHTTDMDTLRDEMLAADLPICPAHFHSQLI
ncbi:hypothetical protein AL048_17610 [Pseudomonas syringae pv. castaneae]|nr:hypothetical protein AL048_17610 [Pseudomonas syringae pv. castaneae]